ncbi:hypothetical protein ACIQUG_06635 [Ensifer sp. NPDC090286]|uniref:hypothetical protein n=1 Tax=Ensifer sp. NPDC090286 TaxID=3363991 RepID=UPI00383B45A7
MLKIESGSGHCGAVRIEAAAIRHVRRTQTVPIAAAQFFTGRLFQSGKGGRGRPVPVCHPSRVTSFC